MPYRDDQAAGLNIGVAEPLQHRDPSVFKKADRRAGGILAQCLRNSALDGSDLRIVWRNGTHG